MGQYADLFARIVNEEQDMPEFMAGEAEALTQLNQLVNDLNGSQYKLAINSTDFSTYLRVTKSNDEIAAIIPFKIVSGTVTPRLSLTVGWGNGEALFNLATEEGTRKAAEAVAIETLGQIHNSRRTTAIMRHFDPH